MKHHSWGFDLISGKRRDLAEQLYPQRKPPAQSYIHPHHSSIARAITTKTVKLPLSMTFTGEPAP